MLTKEEKTDKLNIFSIIGLVGKIITVTLFVLLAIGVLVGYPLSAYPPHHTVADLLAWDRGLALGLFGFAVFVGYLAHILMSSFLDLQGWIADRLHKNKQHQ